MNQGKKVTIVTPSAKEEFEKGHSVNMKEFVEPTFYANGARLFPNATITGVGDGFVSFTAESGVPYEYACDTVIEALDMLPNTELSEGLNVQAICVGDCALPLNIANAIATGNVAARSL